MGTPSPSVFGSAVSTELGGPRRRQSGPPCRPSLGCTASGLGPARDAEGANGGRPRTWFTCRSRQATTGPRTASPAGRRNLGWLGPRSITRSSQEVSPRSAARFPCPDGPRNGRADSDSPWRACLRPPGRGLQARQGSQERLPTAPRRGWLQAEPAKRPALKPGWTMASVPLTAGYRRVQGGAESSSVRPSTRPTIDSRVVYVH
jgi:hypothetical protein